MQWQLSISFFLWLTMAMAAQARPVSYPGGWTLMIRNSADQNSLHAHYTLDKDHSIGLRVRKDRDADALFIGPQAVRLIKRWNKPDSQANIYGRAAIGLVTDISDSPLPARADDIGAFIGVSADWETRRYFTAARFEHWQQGRFGNRSLYHARLGVAPYVANTGALHTWIMVEGHYRPKTDNELGATALLRFFKGPGLLELGIDTQKQPVVNYIHRF